MANDSFIFVVGMVLLCIGLYIHIHGSFTLSQVPGITPGIVSAVYAPVRMGEEWYDRLGRYAFPSPPESENFHRPY